jgi:hypothetical protein
MRVPGYNAGPQEAFVDRGDAQRIATSPGLLNLANATAMNKEQDANVLPVAAVFMEMPASAIAE